MNLAIARSTLVFFPMICVALFVALMAFGPAAQKLNIYGFFFNVCFWLTIPYAVIAIVTGWLAARAGRWATCIFVLILALLATIAFYSRFVEPKRIVIREHTLQVGTSLRIAFIADMHIGFFDGKERVQQIVDELNRLQVDVVAVGGDWTYEPTEPLTELLSPLAQLKHRIVAVLGNHDEGLPGMRVVEQLEPALRQLRVELIEGKIVIIDGVRIAGIGDRFAEKDKLPLFEVANTPHVVLGHNPDSIDRLHGTKIPLLLAGHTHGGQINVPIFTDWILSRFTNGKYKEGLYSDGNYRVFVTAGLGTVGLPLRLFQPPVIDIINLR